jgi:predicted alpha/beta-fold hydrolase
MYPYVMRRMNVPQFKRERWQTLDGDFFDIDTLKRSSDKAIILLHGLEGSSKSQYIQGVIETLINLPIDIYAVNHRSCSGEINHNATMYHSGFTNDLAMILDNLSTYKSVAIVGYSLGGNITLKYLGNNQAPSNVKTAIAISVPVDLASSAIKLNHWTNKAYAIQFLSTLLKKGILKSNQFPEIIKLSDLAKVRTLKGFDEIVTAPLHGFRDADDYYEKASSKPQLHQIAIPTLLLNAHNDTFLSSECYPYEIAKDHPNFHLLTTKFGGHVGFGDWSRTYSFADNVVLEWIQNQMLNE